MKVLILSKGEYHGWLYSQIQNYLAEHNIHIWIDDDGVYPFHLLNVYDVGISFMYTHKVPALQVNTHPWFNFHPAPLPEYRGRNLCYHAIMNREKEFGATLHYMDENFDTGDIIEVQKIPLLPSYTADTVSALAIACSKKLFVDYLPRILAGEEFERKPNVGGTYYPKEVITDTIICVDGGKLSKFVRAVTYKDFHPRLIIGGTLYEVVKVK